MGSSLLECHELRYLQDDYEQARFMCPNRPMGVSVRRFRSGSLMAHVDALSRFPVMFVNHDIFLLKLKALRDTDEEICAIKQIL